MKLRCLFTNSIIECVAPSVDCVRQLLGLNAIGPSRISRQPNEGVVGKLHANFAWPSPYYNPYYVGKMDWMSQVHIRSTTVAVVFILRVV